MKLLYTCGEACQRMKHIGVPSSAERDRHLPLLKRYAMFFDQVSFLENSLQTFDVDFAGKPKRTPELEFLAGTGFLSFIEPNTYELSSLPAEEREVFDKETRVSVDKLLRASRQFRDIDDEMIEWIKSGWNNLAR